MAERVVIGDCTLYRGDCREMPVEGSEDAAVVTDPPYGINFKHKALGAITGDDAAPDIRWLLGIGREHIIWGGNHFADQLPAATRWLMWLKHDPGLFLKRTHGSFDLAWTDLGGSARAFKNIWDGWIRQGEEHNTRSIHPTQKPIALMEWCVGMTTGGTVYDPFMGSGTTGIAAVRAGRRFVGVEIDPAHFATACHRLRGAGRRGETLMEVA